MLNKEQNERVEQLLERLEGRPESHRDHVLNLECPDDPAVRHEVQRLLAQSAASFDESAIRDEFARHLWEDQRGDNDALIGRQLGAYRIDRRIGQGGMGVVYEAWQANPPRAVALKLLRSSFATKDTRHRFVHETRVLGRLQHPGIAHIYEAGTAELSSNGAGVQQPFFAMEFIRGKRLDSYARDADLSLRQRLVLLVKICEAVHHAHQQGVVHRDLKPSNILVVEPTADVRETQASSGFLDSVGQPKILDFGVARITDADRDITKQTEVGQLVGTLPYMSPEQVVGIPEAIDTRSDVYALGIIGYELLAGRLPYDLSNRTIPQAIKVISDIDAKPLGEIDRVLRGDVETIFSKALEKDKSSRYTSAAALADDIRNYLSNLPIAARPATTVYQLSKFAKRNKVLVGGVVATIAALAIGLTFAVVGFAQARAQATRADREAEAAQSSLDFLVDSLESASALRGGRDVTMLGVLRSGATQIEDKFADRPIAKAKILATYGRVYRTLGEFPEAERYFAKALAAAGGVLPDADPQVAELRNWMGEILRNQGRDTEAAKFFDLRHSLLEPSLRETAAERAEDYNNKATRFHGHGDYQMAEFCYRSAVGGVQYLSTESVDLATYMTWLGRMLVEQDRLQEGEQLILEANSMRRRVTSDQTSVAQDLLTLGFLRHAQGDFAAALEAYRQSRDLYLETKKAEHDFNVQLATMDLAGLLEDATLSLSPSPDDLDVASSWSPTSASEANLNQFGISLRNRGRILYRNQRYSDGDERFARSIAVFRSLEGRDRRLQEAHTRRVWGDFLLARGDFETAKAQYEVAIEVQRGNVNEATIACLVPTLAALARLYLSLGQPDRADPLLKEAWELRQQTAPEGSPPWTKARDEYAECLGKLGRIAEAQALIAEATEPVTTEPGSRRNSTRSTDGKSGDRTLPGGQNRP